MGNDKADARAIDTAANLSPYTQAQADLKRFITPRQKQETVDGTTDRAGTTGNHQVSKDKNGIVTRETLTQSWTDWIDYWAVDFNFESKREIVRVKNEDNGEWEERWTGDYIFENEWQSFRTKKDRSLELTSVFHECSPGRRKVAVKVVDIFGNDTMTIVEVRI